MKIDIIVPVYNEEFFLPMFLQHHAWVDKIIVLFANNSTDRSREILDRYSRTFQRLYGKDKIEIIDATEPEGINDQMRIEKLMLCYKASHADWVMQLDCDEFVMIDRKYIESIPGQFNLLSLKIFQVYPHETDKPLVQSIPIFVQRRHGVVWGNRPVIMRTKQDIMLGIGKHSIEGDIREYPYHPWLLHGQMADIDNSLNRRLNNRKGRMSPLNQKMGWGFHEFNVTKEELMKEFKEHEKDLIVI